MKSVMICSVALMFSACVSKKAMQIQVSVVQAQLIKVDTLYRDREYVQLLTWRSPQHVEFVSYAGMKEYYPVGAKMAVFVPR